MATSASQAGVPGLSSGYFGRAHVRYVTEQYLDAIYDYSIALRGRRVTVIPDNDAPGREHAEHVAGSLMMFGASAVRVVELPGVGEGGDVSDWAALNREIDARGELISMIRQTREWRAA